MNRRQDKRFAGFCKVDFVSDGKEYTGKSNDFALNGLFIVTGDPKAPGTIIDILIHLPNGSTSKLRGKVRRFFKTFTGNGIEIQIQIGKDGMGVEIIEKDSSYLHFIRSLLIASKNEMRSSMLAKDADPRTNGIRV